MLYYCINLNYYHGGEFAVHDGITLGLIARKIKGSVFFSVKTFYPKDIQHIN